MGGACHKQNHELPDDDDMVDGTKQEIRYKRKTAPTAVDQHTDPNIKINLERPLDDDKFTMGSPYYRHVRQKVLEKSEETGTQQVWKDTHFPASEESLCFSRPLSLSWTGLEWKRPHNISADPRLLENDVSPDDIIQGDLRDCWWLSAVAAVARTPRYMDRVIPKDQVLSGNEYVGMFRFYFWRFGSWVEVIVDDRLPTKDGKLVMGSSAVENEYWLPLMEKAYAKLHDSYEAIERGVTRDALEDLTGGMAITTELGSETSDRLFESLVKALRNESFVCCSIAEGVEHERKTGLTRHHAYTVTGAQTVRWKSMTDKISYNTAKLVRIRNPFGNEREWKGKWSDHSSIWDDVDSSVQNLLDYSEDGEWWMEFLDFKHYFSDVTICTLGPDSDGDGVSDGNSWFLSTANGVWKGHKSAGERKKSMRKYATKPQYLLELKDPDDFDPSRDAPEQRGKCSVVMGLMQEYRIGLENLYLKLEVYKLRRKPRRRLSAKYFQKIDSYVTSGAHFNSREVNITTELDPGYYVVIPSRDEPDKPGSFLLRIFTEKRIDLKELK